MPRKVIARMKGGLGNQLFIYAAARRLALSNEMELVLDNVSGFVRDRTYMRRYALEQFSIPCRFATSWERLEPFERSRRALSKWIARRRSWPNQGYTEQQGSGFDERLLNFRPSRDLYLDGLWQDERHFADIADTIRADLSFRGEIDRGNLEIASRMKECKSVALHVRWFNSPCATLQEKNLTVEYYQRAVREIERRVPDARFFLFSDNINAAKTKLNIPPKRLICVGNNEGDAGAIADLRLMGCCKHFIVANSTFSWWGAWLSTATNRIVLMPPGLPNMSTALVWRTGDQWSLTENVSSLSGF